MSTLAGREGGRRPWSSEMSVVGAGGQAGSSPYKVEGEPVHEYRLRSRHRHGQVHAQLVPRPAHWHSFGCCLGQNLEPQCPDLGGKGKEGQRGGPVSVRQPGVSPCPSVASSLCSQKALLSSYLPQAVSKPQ